MAICENMTIKVVGGFHNGRIGKVDRVYPGADCAIISFCDNGDVGKVPLAWIFEAQPQEKPVEPEIPEGAKKITRSDFEELFHKCTLNSLYGRGNPAGNLAKTAILLSTRERVCREIFGDQDSVVMTEIEFISAVWNALNPRNLIEMVETIGKSPLKPGKLSVAAYIGYEEIVGILFGGANG